MTKEFDAKNAAKSRAKCAEMAEDASTGKRVLTERERQILDLWPRFEDGEPVMVGDKYEDNEGNECFASGVHLDIDGPSLVDTEGFHDLYRNGKRVKRPVQRVLDDDGVEIEVGDTVYEPNGKAGVVIAVHPSTRCVDLRQDDCDAYAMDAMRLTHTRPDSWERLEEDAGNSICGYFGKGVSECDGCPANALAANSDEFECCERAVKLDIIRRAKALAGIEVAE